jgi:hypothetical protein
LRLTFHSSLAEFTSSEAIQYLNGFNNGNHPSEDQVTLLQRMTFKHPIKQDIEAFAVAETEFDVKVQRKMEVDWQLNARQRAMEEAENNAKLAVEVSVDTAMQNLLSIWSSIVSLTHAYVNSRMKNEREKCSKWLKSVSPNLKKHWWMRKNHFAILMSL